MYKTLFFIGFLSLTLALGAQELKCKVQVLFQKVPNVDPQVFKSLETSVYEFMNNRKWTAESYAPEEKIECSMLINIDNEVAQDRYAATVTIQASRPVFNSSYNTVLLNYSDKDWIFDYAQFQQLEFNDNQFFSNLTSMLAFYAYYIIALDLESFSPKGGSKYLTKAQNVIENIPSNFDESSAPGWRPFEGQRNRYWMIENTLSPRFQSVRETFYQYHMQGLDKMYGDLKTGRQNVLNALKKCETVFKENPNAMIVQLFFNAKRNELINIFSGAPVQERAQAAQVLIKMDPTNADQYTAMSKLN